MKRRRYLKPKSSSVLASLPRAKREIIEGWLFEENLGYAKVAARAKEVFKVELHYKSIQRYYQRLARNRNVARLTRDRKSTETLIKTFGKNPGKAYQALLNIAGQIAFNIITNTEEGEDPDLGPLHDTIQLLIAARKDEREDKKFSLERDKWEFDVTEACLKKLPELKVISDAPQIPYKEKIRQIRLELFGTAPD